MAKTTIRTPMDVDEALERIENTAEELRGSKGRTFTREHCKNWAMHLGGLARLIRRLNAAH